MKVLSGNEGTHDAKKHGTFFVRLLVFPEPAFSGMDFSKFAGIDPHMLVGLVNTELRNHSESLEDLVKTHGISKDELIRKLSDAGYEYRGEQKQFR